MQKLPKISERNAQKNVIPKTWQDAFIQQGLDPKLLPDVSMIPLQYRRPIIAEYILCVVATVLNGDWVSDYTDLSQDRYEPRFIVKADKKRPSGIGLSYCDFINWRSTTLCGVRLTYKDAQTAYYAGKTFIKLYEDLYLPHNE